MKTLELPVLDAQDTIVVYSRGVRIIAEIREIEFGEKTMLIRLSYVKSEVIPIGRVT